MVRGNQVGLLKIAKPCQASWENMAGAGAERFCESCQKTVHDFTLLTKRQAEELLNRADGRLCARVAHDMGGRVVFAKRCRPNAWERLVQISMLGVSALSAQAMEAQTVAESAKACKVAVRVTDADGALVNGARVNIHSAVEGTAHESGLTEGGGIFAASVPEGRQSVSAEAVGSRSAEVSLDVRCDEKSSVVNVEVRLTASFTTVGEVEPMMYRGGAKAHLRRWWYQATRPFRRVFARG